MSESTECGGFAHHLDPEVRGSGQMNERWSPTRTEPGATIVA